MYAYLAVKKYSLYSGFLVVAGWHSGMLLCPARMHMCIFMHRRESTGLICTQLICFGKFKVVSVRMRVFCCGLAFIGAFYQTNKQEAQKVEFNTQILGEISSNSRMRWCIFLTSR